MTIQLFVHGSYYRTVPASAIAPLRVLCDEPVGGGPPAGHGHPAADVPRLVRFASFEPVPGTANTIWECHDPGVAVRDGRLVAVGEGPR